jgi:hypothetical protein
MFPDAPASKKDMFHSSLLTARALALVIFMGASPCPAQDFRGAENLWTTYEAEDGITTGTKLGPKYAPNTVESESSGRKCVQLNATGQYVEFAAQAAANAMVVRYCVPDSPDGIGIDSTLSLYVNGNLAQKLPVTSKFSWIYGPYPFFNDPAKGAPRKFYDEVRVKDLSIRQGDNVRLQKDKEDMAASYIIDLIDLENIAPPLSAPANSLSIAGFGASGAGLADDTGALRDCIAAAKAEGKIAWVPAGTYKITGDIGLPSDVTIQGAGMWHTTFVGDAGQYSNSQHRVRFQGSGDNIHLADFAILGKLDHRNDREPNDGLVGSYGSGSTLSRLWVEHTKTGAWIDNSSGLMISGCRFRNTMADGVNLCVGMRGTVIENCAARGTGDDCFAIWPATYMPQKYAPGLNVIRHCTGQLAFLANGAAIYGGEGNTVEDCLFSDLSYGCGILISTTFPVGNNNFSGATLVQRCELIRCGGYEHDGRWRGAVELYADRHNLPGVRLNNLTIRDSTSDGISIIASGSGPGQGALSEIAMDGITIPNFGLGAPNHHGLWVRKGVQGSASISHSTIVEHQHDSTGFSMDWFGPTGAAR